jgi:DNA-binding NtrC family response regulator
VTSNDTAGDTRGRTTSSISTSPQPSSRELIERAVVGAEGNRVEAARLLGIARPQRYAKMKELGIAPSHRPKKLKDRERD